MITFDKVTKSYGSAVAVDELSLEIAEGTLSVFVGPSGAARPPPCE